MHTIAAFWVFPTCFSEPAGKAWEVAIGLHIRYGKTNISKPRCWMPCFKLWFLKKIIRHFLRFLLPYYSRFQLTSTWHARLRHIKKVPHVEEGDIYIKRIKFSSITYCCLEFVLKTVSLFKMPNLFREEHRSAPSLETKKKLCDILHICPQAIV